MERVQERAKRSGPVTHSLLLLQRNLTEGSAQLVGQEVRIVPESAGSPRLVDDAPVDFPSSDHFAVSTHENRDADV